MKNGISKQIKDFKQNCSAAGADWRGNRKMFVLMLARVMKANGVSIPRMPDGKEYFSGYQMFSPVEEILGQASDAVASECD